MRKTFAFLWASFTVAFLVLALDKLSPDRALAVSFAFAFESAVCVAIFCWWRKVSFWSLLRQKIGFTIWLAVLALGTHEVTTRAFVALFTETPIVLALLGLTVVVYVAFDLVTPYVFVSPREPHYTKRRSTPREVFLVFGPAHEALWRIVDYFVLIEMIYKTVDLLYMLGYGYKAVPDDFVRHQLALMANAVVNLGPSTAQLFAALAPFAVLVSALVLGNRGVILARSLVNHLLHVRWCRQNGVINETITAVY